MTDRRDFLATAFAGLSLLALPAHARKAARPLKILVLGGTGFLGPQFVEVARARGLTLTLFNRGKTNPERFAGDDYRDVEQLHGDRKTDLSALEGGRRWDAVLDTSAYLPADVTRSTQLLGKRGDRLDHLRLREDRHTGSGRIRAELSDPDVTEVTGETYGGLKALCEKAAQAQMPVGSRSCGRD